jgi:hypothetical protein
MTTLSEEEYFEGRMDSRISLHDDAKLHIVDMNSSAKDSIDLALLKLDKIETKLRRNRKI